MKKCPYCFTLMNNDVKVCPKCLKSMENLKPMKEVAPKDNQLSYYSLVFGIIIAVGSIFAAISQKGNENSYTSQYNAVLASYNSETSENVKTSLQSQGEALWANIKTCQFREIAFYVMCGIGCLLVLYAIISFIVKKSKQKKKISN